MHKKWDIRAQPKRSLIQLANNQTYKSKTEPDAGPATLKRWRKKSATSSGRSVLRLTVKDTHYGRRLQIVGSMFMTFCSSSSGNGSRRVLGPAKPRVLFPLTKHLCALCRSLGCCPSGLCCHPLSSLNGASKILHGPKQTRIVI